MRILISACLLGLACRYDGKGKEYPQIARLAKEHTLIPVCPECYGGLPTPRPPAERRGERVVTAAGSDVTEAYRKGAQAALQLCRTLDIRVAVLKEKSPSCGSGTIYDGSFNRTLTAGNGVAAQLLKENGIRVWGESEIEALLEALA